MQYRGPGSVGQYNVDNVGYNILDTHNGTKLVRVEVKLVRDFPSIFIVTYLPTILMNIINQATNYLANPEFLEAIITVNITCMMVLSALYISVSNSLPATSTIKIVDIWLLFSLIFPFFIILINILLYTIRERKKATNTKTEQTKIFKYRYEKYSVETFLKSTARNALPFIYISFVFFYLLCGFIIINKNQ